MGRFLLGSFRKHRNFASIMITKLLFTTLCGLAGSCSTLSAQGIDSLFARAPEAACPMLSHSSKLDLLDLYNSRMKAVTTNQYGGQTTLTEKSDDFLTLQQTASSDWSMKLFKAPTQSYILVCQTFRTPYAESQLTWYDDKWNRITPPAGFSLPQPSDFATGTSDSLQNAVKVWPGHYISATLATGSDSIRFELAPTSASSDLNRQARQMLHPIILKWDKQKYQFVNCPAQK